MKTRFALRGTAVKDGNLDLFGQGASPAQVSVCGGARLMPTFAKVAQGFKNRLAPTRT